MVGGMDGRGHAWQERRPLQRAVRILLECILNLFIVTQIKLKNKTEEERNVTFRVSGIVAYYTGKPSERIFSKSFTDKLEPNEGIFSYLIHKCATNIEMSEVKFVSVLVSKILFGIW